MKLYSVTASVVYQDGRWQGSKQVPAFLLSDHQVANLDQAERLAHEIVDPLGKATAVYISVVEL
jgi:hypothetical protein